MRNLSILVPCPLCLCPFALLYWANISPKPLKTASRAAGFSAKKIAKLFFIYPVSFQLALIYKIILKKLCTCFSGEKFNWPMF
jgi:hypothetical protein